MNGRSVGRVFSARRRRVLAGLVAGATLAGGGVYGWCGVFNGCRGALPPALADHEWVRAAWAGIAPERFIDSHVHLIGTGDAGSGIEVNPQMTSLWHPLQYAQRVFYMNAACVDAASGQVDEGYVERLRLLVDGLRPGARVLLFAFDRFHDADGRADPQRSTFYTPNAYARAVAARYPRHFAWAASIHPYREDGVEALVAAVDAGALAVKWLPPAMGIDPGSPRCDRFYEALARYGVPLITHAGEEKAVHGGDTQAYGNPLLLRRALEHGVRVVVAHCASLGAAVDLDRGANAAPRACFELFARLMDDARYENVLFADISAVAQRNRDEAVLRVLLERGDWHRRLLNGSDYPLPGVLPLTSPADLAARKLLPASVAPLLEEIRQHNPLLFDFVLKRHLSWQGRRFATGIFETRAFFERKTA